jgi:hypothetical protein
MGKISVLSMFRDSQDYLAQALHRLDALEKETKDFSFEYFFYENDSIDNTVSILNKWVEEKNGSLLSETLNKPKFSQSTAVQRQIDMAHYRNRMLDNAKPLDSTYTLVLDSDVIFDASLINNYLEYFDNEVAMVTPNVLQNIKCKMFDQTQDSYYDSFALLDNYNNQGLTWASNPFFHPADRKYWEEGRPVEVKSAFGGAPLIKTSVLNEIGWSTDGGCEHWNFCRDIREYGKITVAPTVKVRVELGSGVIDSLDPTHVLMVVEKQKQLFQLLNTTL